MIPTFLLLAYVVGAAYESFQILEQAGGWEGLVRECDRDGIGEPLFSSTTAAALLLVVAFATWWYLVGERGYRLLTRKF